MGRSQRLKFGPGRVQRVTITPARAAAQQPASQRTVLLIHGGSWRWPWGRWLMVFVARDLRMRGYRTATAGYRRLGRFGGGGGFPETFDDVKSALEVTVGAPGVDREQLVVVGHSAGGHLALWLATERPALCRGAVSIAGLADLEPSWDRNVASVVALIEKAPAADRFEATSPLHRVPSGLPTACVHSTSDETVDHAVSRRFVDASTAAGDPADLTLVDDESHRAGLWPASATWQAAVERLEHIFASSQG